MKPLGNRLAKSTGIYLLVMGQMSINNTTRRFANWCVIELPSCIGIGLRIHCDFVNPVSLRTTSTPSKRTKDVRQFSRTLGHDCNVRVLRLRSDIGPDVL